MPDNLRPTGAQIDSLYVVRELPVVFAAGDQPAEDVDRRAERRNRRITNWLGKLRDDVERRSVRSGPDLRLRTHAVVATDQRRQRPDGDCRRVGTHSRHVTDHLRRARRRDELLDGVVHGQRCAAENEDPSSYKSSRRAMSGEGQRSGDAHAPGTRIEVVDNGI